MQNSYDYGVPVSPNFGTINLKDLRINISLGCTAFSDEDNLPSVFALSALLEQQFKNTLAPCIEKSKWFFPMRIITIIFLYLFYLSFVTLVLSGLFTIILLITFNTSPLFYLICHILLFSLPIFVLSIILYSTVTYYANKMLYLNLNKLLKDRDPIKIEKLKRVNTENKTLGSIIRDITSETGSIKVANTEDLMSKLYQLDKFYKDNIDPYFVEQKKPQESPISYPPQDNLPSNGKELTYNSTLGIGSPP